MKPYNSGSPLAKLIFGGEFRYETYFFLFLNNERGKQCVRSIFVEGPSYRGYNTFRELFTQKILNKEDLKQNLGTFTR